MDHYGNFIEAMSYHRMSWREIFYEIARRYTPDQNTDTVVAVKLVGAEGDTPCTLVAPDNETSVQVRLCNGPGDTGLIVVPENLADAFMILSGAYGKNIDERPAIFGRDIEDPEDVTFVEHVSVLPGNAAEGTLDRIMLMPNRASLSSLLFEDAMFGDEDDEDEED